MPLFHEFAIDSIDSTADLLSDCRDKVVLAVNVASKCGFTPQYAGLEALYRDLKDEGFVVIGFPCNQFGAQEPGDAAAIQQFCSTTYDVSFPISEKIEVNGPGRHPLYAWLTDEGNGFAGDIEWNFEKFLIGRSGRALARYPSATTPDDPGLLQDIAAALEGYESVGLEVEFDRHAGVELDLAWRVGFGAFRCAAGHLRP